MNSQRIVDVHSQKCVAKAKNVWGCNLNKKNCMNTNYIDLKCTLSEHKISVNLILIIKKNYFKYFNKLSLCQDKTGNLIF